MDAKMLFLMNGFTENKVMDVTDDDGVFISQRRSIVAVISGMTKYRKGPQRTAKEHYTGPQRIGNHERTARLATILFNF